jgi:hypothetical protein
LVDTIKKGKLYLEESHLSIMNGIYRLYLQYGEQDFREVVSFPDLSNHLYIAIIIHLQASPEPPEDDCFHYMHIPTSKVLQPLSNGSGDCSIIVRTIVGILDGVISKASEVVIRQGIGLRLARQEARHGTHPICSFTTSSTTNVR